jgi:hypothetical protein
MNIHCIGNSHLNTFSYTSGFTNFQFSNNPIFRFHWLGPVIAYNYYEHYLQKTKEYLKTINKENDYVIIVVGEVDCRLHLPKQADEQHKSDDTIVKECIDRLSRVFNELKQEYKLIIFGTHPTTPEQHNMSNIDRPIYGDMKRRNNICVLWNNYLQQYSKDNNISYISIYEYLVDEHNNTKTEYFFDYCHLNGIKVIPFIQQEFLKIGITLHEPK